MAEARKLADQYQIVLSFEGGHWYGRGLELPNTFGDGPTVQECVADTREALAASVAYLLEQGETPPAPAREGVRTEQVNVRLTAEEKLQLETSARAKGFKGISDYLRAAALESKAQPPHRARQRLRKIA